MSDRGAVPQGARRSIVAQPLGGSSYASTSAHSCSKNGELRQHAKPRQLRVYERLVESILRKLGVAPAWRRQDEFGVRFAAKLT